MRMKCPGCGKELTLVLSDAPVAAGHLCSQCGGPTVREMRYPYDKVSKFYCERCHYMDVVE